MRVIVVSHERSGTHLTLNSLHENNCVNVPTSDRNIVNGFLYNYKGNRILKSHHSAEWFDDWVFDSYNVVYVKRNLFDTLNSMYFYCKRHPNVFGDFGTIGEFVWKTPDSSKDVYSFNHQSNFVDRILNHRISFENKKIIEVNYETIVNDYSSFRDTMNSYSIPSRNSKPKMGEGQYVSPRKGIVGDYKNNMSSELIRNITQYVKEKYGYDTVK